MSPVQGEFFDSNVLVYAFAADPRAAPAQALLERGGIISVQGLNEFANVAKRKLAMTWQEVRDALGAIRTLCPTIVSMDIEAHDDGLRIAERYGCSIFDALTIASAIRAGCHTLWSEDMKHGVVIDERVRIANPFRPTS
jgi:predicted nucleic acid-binding protein